MMDSLRTRRVAELLKHELAAVIAEEINDPRVHDVVITHVKVTKDLSIARVYFSSYNKIALEGIEKGLNKSAGFIRKCLMPRVHLKKLPQIVFERDLRPENVVQVDELLRQIHEEHSEKT